MMNVTTNTAVENDLNDQTNPDPDSNHATLPPLDSRIIEAIRQKPDLTIWPAELATSLGISIDDANAELCGLLRAVGPSATFRFETIPSKSHNLNTDKMHTVMVFSFPHDFEKKACAYRRKEEVKDICWNIVYALIKILKVIVAFGLIISLAVVFIGGVCLLIATIIALSRNGGNRHNSQHHSRRVVSYSRTMWYSIRQLLFAFTIGSSFADEDGGGQVDPFVRDIAYTLAYWNPRSLWFWLRMYRIRNRQQRINRGWRVTNSGPMNTPSWNGQNNNSNNTRGRENLADRLQSDERGILSIIVEFLFGPSPFQPGPSEFDKWKIREHFILTKHTTQEEGGISMIQFLPFVDSPPSPLLQESQLWENCQTRTECLKIITHFNGVPYNPQPCETLETSSSSSESSFKAHFVFPELIISESANSVELHNSSLYKDGEESHDISFFFSQSEEKENCHNEGHGLGNRSMTAQNHSQDQLQRLMPSTEQNTTSTLHFPKFLYERRHVLTKLTQSEFKKCILLNVLNYIGLLILWKSIHADGAVLKIQDKTSFKYHIIKSMLLMLFFYAKLFFALPLLRMITLMVLNRNINTRNARRESFA